MESTGVGATHACEVDGWLWSNFVAGLAVLTGFCRRWVEDLVYVQF